jgi:ligand-binding sensor domain-containing protein
MVLSKPFFYNVIKSEDGRVFVGTSEGIYQLEGTKMVHFVSKKGYVTILKNGEVGINPEGIKNYIERKYLYLLPFPNLVRDEYHAGTNDYFYICSGGRIYIFDIVPYQYSYANHSIRSISENLVGTYSGIYFKGTRLESPAPNFCDGYIHEYDGKAFVCYDAMMIVDVQSPQPNQFDTSSVSYWAYEKSHIHDIYKLPNNGNYYVATNQELLLMNKSDYQFKKIYQSTNKKNEINILGNNTLILLFSDANYLLRYYDEHTDTLKMLDDVILDGVNDNRNLYLLTNKALYLFKSDNSFSLLATIPKAHTMKMISSTELVIATDDGLYRFNTLNLTLSPLIIGVEFNRRALFLKDNKLYAGSINGLYTIDVNDFDELIKRNKAEIEGVKLPVYIYYIVIGIGLISIMLIYLLIRARKKLENAETKIEELNISHTEVLEQLESPLDREQIEAYIRENLSTASLKSITSHFETTTRHIYKIIEPEKPGSIIQKLRMEMVMEMKKSGAGLEQIAESTGLSVSYIRKMSNK